MLVNSIFSFFHRVFKRLVKTGLVWEWVKASLKHDLIRMRSSHWNPTRVYQINQQTKNDWSINRMVLNAVSTLFQLYRGDQGTHPCIPTVLLTSTPHNILSKPLAAFPQNHRRNNGQGWERNESCRNDYHQSSERILAEPKVQTSDLLFWSLRRHRPSYRGKAYQELFTWFFPT